MNGYALKQDGSYRAVTDQTPLQEGEIFVIELPDLSNSTIELLRQHMAARRSAAYDTIKNIPNWATWTQADWSNYFQANLSDGQADLVTSLATARIMIKRQNAVIDAIAKVIIAMRDNLYPDLPG